MASYDSIMGQQVALSRKIPRKEDEVPPWEGAAPGATFNVPASSVPPEVAGAYANNPDGTVTLPAGVMPAYKGGGTVTPGPTAPVQTDTEVPEQGGSGPMSVPARTQPQQYTAGGMMRTGETRQVGIGINAAERANLDMGHDRQAQAMRDAALQGQAKAVEEAEYVKATADQQEQHAIEMKAREYDREQKTEAAMAPMRALSDELAAGKVDPSRYLQNQSTGAKLATMLSVVLGAGAAQRINGRNVGLDMMNDAIARDVDAQKASFDMKRGALGVKQNLYGQMLQNFGREDLAKEAAHLAILKGYGAKISAIGAKYAGTEIANKAEAAAGQFQEQYGERELKLRQATSDVVTTQDTYRAPQLIGGGSGGGGGKEGKHKDVNALFVPELGGYARTEKEASELRTQTGAGRFIIKQLGVLKQMARKLGTLDKAGNVVGYTTDALAQMKRQAGDLVQPLVGLYGGGAAAKDEAEAAMNRFIGTIRPGTDAEQAVDEQIGRVTAKMDGLKSSAGIREGKEIFAVDEGGVMVQGGMMTGRMAGDVPQEKPVAVQPIKAGK